jgi:hypothetical protein
MLTRVRGNDSMNWELCKDCQHTLLRVEGAGKEGIKQCMRAINCLLSNKNVGLAVQIAMSKCPVGSLR